MPSRKPKGRKATRKPVRSVDIDPVFWKLFVDTVNTVSTTGIMCMERFTCPECGTPQMTSHPFAETLECGKCGNRCVSRSPRPIARGEVTAVHLQTAIGIVGMRTTDQKLGTTPVEVTSLPDELKLPVLSRCNREVQEALRAVLSVAGAMAMEERTLDPASI